ncbi:MAG: IS200/IS605 family transposase [Ignavibacteria bacterium]|jgi:REP element-mobilizing transposase RayT|nr:IS200/IS605 family transposase [Ignavibacteria bacterium]
MPHTKIWIHIVFSTFERKPFLHDSIREKIFNHIFEYSKSKDIYIDRINGYVDHVHILISLSRDQTISKVMQFIKGESSHWINKNNLTKEKFEWQDEYFAVSVSESKLDIVRKYIDNQVEHHKIKSFKEEYDEFMKKYGFSDSAKANS